MPSLDFAQIAAPGLPARQRWLYWAYYGPFRKIICKASQVWLLSSAGVRFGPGRGLRLLWFDMAYRLGVYELHVQQTLKTLLKPGDNFFDIGADMGFYAVLGARFVGSRGKVFAFERFAGNCERIRELMQANVIDNIQVIPKSVGNAVGWVGFHAKGSAAEAAPAKDGKHLVPITTLDEFTREQSPPDAVLVDQGGAELLVLEGAKKLLQSTPPRFWVVAVNSPETLHAVGEVLAAHNYNLQMIKPPVDRKGAYPRHILAKSSTPSAVRP